MGDSNAAGQPNSQFSITITVTVTSSASFGTSIRASHTVHVKYHYILVNQVHMSRIEVPG